MSVWFYCDIWAFANDPQNLDKITDQQLMKLAIEPRAPDEYEKKPYLLEVRKERAGKIEQKFDNMLKISAGGSRGHCLNAKKLAVLHKDVLFIVISGADCTEEETVSLFKNGEKVYSFDAVLIDDKFLTELQTHHQSFIGEELCARMEKSYNDLIDRVVDDKAQDAILQDDPEEQ